MKPNSRRGPSVARGPEEIEVKLRLPPDARPVLEAQPALHPPRAGTPETREEETTYFDTPDGLLARAGASLRVRRSLGRGLVQTLKLAPVAQGAAARRGEWEWPVGAETPDLGLLAGTPCADSVPALDRALTRVCKTEISRTAWRVACAGGTVVEAAIDQGRIRAGQRDVPVSELELELKAGGPAALYRLALELVQAVPLAIEPASKAERGAQLAGRPGPEAVKAEDVVLRPDQPAAEAFAHIMGAALGHLRLNLPATVRGDVEGVHQVRIAVRRVRAVIALFKPLLTEEAASRYNEALRRAGRLFGAARDWDVFVTATLAEAAAENPAESWPRHLAEAARPARARAREEAMRELEAPGFARLLLELGAWAEEGARDPATLGTPALTRPVADVAPDLLDRLMRRAAKQGKGIRHADPRDLHGLRKRLKTLRYGTEFTESLYRPKRVRTLLHPCKELQELLGSVNDAAATPDLAQHLADSDESGIAPCLAALAAWTEGRGKAARRRVPKAWHALRDADPFWA
ncbi:MAG TPA: CYTH and CHAD domain-containing protein [Acetobacteraceae bacterium]|nr:CYTH and CHAD domain-containing protein [Acetobacteraceae bacterium]